MSPAVLIANELREAIREERDRLLDLGSVKPRDLWTEVKDRHPDVVAAFQERLAEQRGVDLCQRDLKASAQPSQQATLPGFGETRRTLTVPDGEGGFVYVPLERAILGDVDADLEVSQINRDLVVAEHQSRQVRRDLLYSVPGACPEMAVVDVLRQLNGT
jgi:hypothetical protein